MTGLAAPLLQCVPYRAAARMETTDSAGGPLLDLRHRLVDGLRDVVDVLGGHAAHVDTTARHQVDVLLLYEISHLLSCRAERGRIK